MNRILGVLICAFIAATAYITTTVSQRQQVLRNVAHHNDAWAIGQSVTEFMRLEALLASYSIPEQHVQPDDVRLRLDIIVSRLASLREGSIKNFLGSSGVHRATVDEVTALIRELDANFESMDRTELLAILERMQSLNGPVIQLSSYSVQQGWTDIDESLNALHDLHRVFASVVALLIVAWCVLLALQLKRNTQLRIAQDHANSLNNDLVAKGDELREKNRSLEYTAYHDSLTRLPNRTLFWKEIETLLERECKVNDKAVHLLLIDLDDFKAVNDTMGHDLGDLLLTKVGERLIEFKNQAYILSRLGGDEFACAILDKSEGEVQRIARSLAASLTAPYYLSGRKARIGCSIGIAGATRTNCLTAQAMFKQADLALYQAKEALGGNIRVFEEHMLRDFDDRKALEHDLREALARSEFELLYQAQVDIKTLELRGLEALSRWNHPSRGIISPNLFIPLAEGMGLIGQLGKLVLESACKEAMRWKRPLKVSVNISPLQLLERGFAESVAKVLHETGLPPKRLELEITETVLLEDRDGAVAVVNDLRSLGLTVALDDFGTGYSSLAILRDIPFDTLKLDKSFVRDIATNELAATLVRLVVDIGSRLGKTVIVEGVETRAQHEKILQIGGLLSQGFLFARPVRSEKLAFLRDDEQSAGLIEDFAH